MRIVARTAILTGIILLASQAARATTLIQTYNNLTAWQLAVAELGVDTFEGKAPSGGIAAENAGYLDAEGVNFQGFWGSSNDLEIIDAAYPTTPPGGFNFGTGASLSSWSVLLPSYQPSIKATLPAVVTAIALDVMTAGGSGPVTLTFSDGTVVPVTTFAGQESFIGFTFNAPIGWLTLSIPGSPNGTSVLLDNFAIGTADVEDPVPEPVTLLLVGMGLVMMALMGRKGTRLLP